QPDAGAGRDRRDPAAACRFRTAAGGGDAGAGRPAGAGGRMTAAPLPFCSIPRHPGHRTGTATPPALRPGRGRRALARGAALLALAGAPALAQTFVPDASGRQGAALAPTESTGLSGMLADGTSLLRLPVVVAPSRPAQPATGDAGADSAATLLADRFEVSGDR